LLLVSYFRAIQTQAHLFFPVPRRVLFEAYLFIQKPLHSMGTRKLFAGDTLDSFVTVPAMSLMKIGSSASYALMHNIIWATRVIFL
jgi:hypothetical protein